MSSCCSQRLLSLLNQALFRCKEEEKQLEEQLGHWRALLDNWDTDSCEHLKQVDKASESQEIQPSPRDLREVELLNKALEKALRVRGTSKTDSSVNKTQSSVQTPSSCPVTKENPIKALNERTQKGTKPVTYQLNPPYKTVPDRRRVQKSGQGTSSNKSTRSTPLEQPAPQKSNGGEGRQLETNPTPPCSALAKPVSPPSTISYPEISPQKPSTLKDKGATLKLPVNYQQAYMKSNRLWEKFYAIQDHLPAPKPSFIQKLQTTFAPEAPERSLFEIEEDTTRLQREVRSWQQNLDSANNGQGSVAEEYRNWAEKHSINTSSVESTGCPSMYSGPPPVLIYHHPDELRELTRSRLRVLELQQKIHLQKVFGEELLAEAESLSRSAPTSCLPLRAIYTLLCEGGDTFPALVHDDG